VGAKMTSYLIAGIGIVAFWLLGGGRKARAVGFVLNLLNQVIWVVYALATDQPGFIIGAVVFGAVTVRNLYRLRREG
jgi:hypothetical protein